MAVDTAQSGKVELVPIVPFLQLAPRMALRVPAGLGSGAVHLGVWNRQLAQNGGGGHGGIIVRELVRVVLRSGSGNEKIVEVNGCSWWLLVGMEWFSDTGIALYIE
jgi:hypothetical protein